MTFPSLQLQDAPFLLWGSPSLWDFACWNMLVVIWDWSLWRHFRMANSEWGWKNKAPLYSCPPDKTNKKKPCERIPCEMHTGMQTNCISCLCFKRHQCHVQSHCHGIDNQLILDAWHFRSTVLWGRNCFPTAPWKVARMLRFTGCGPDKQNTENGCRGEISPNSWSLCLWVSLTVRDHHSQDETTNMYPPPLYSNCDTPTFSYQAPCLDLVPVWVQLEASFGDELAPPPKPFQRQIHKHAVGPTDEASGGCFPIAGLTLTDSRCSFVLCCSWRVHLGGVLQSDWSCGLQEHPRADQTSCAVRHCLFCMVLRPFCEEHVFLGR